MDNLRCGHAISDAVECDGCEKVVCASCDCVKACAGCNSALCDACSRSVDGRICSECGGLYCATCVANIGDCCFCGTFLCEEHDGQRVACASTHCDTYMCHTCAHDHSHHALCYDCTK